MIELRKLTEDNYDECFKLEIKQEQGRFVASNIYTLAEAYVALTNNDFIPMPYAIYNNETMVGFICMSYQYDDRENGEESYYPEFRK